MFSLETGKAGRVVIGHVFLELREALRGGRFSCDVKAVAVRSTKEPRKVTM